MIKITKKIKIDTCDGLTRDAVSQHSHNARSASCVDRVAVKAVHNTRKYLLWLAWLVLVSLLILTMAGCAADTDSDETTENQSTETTQQGNTDEQPSENDNTDSSPEEQSNEFWLNLGGNEIRLHQQVDPVLEDLGSELNYFEAESCAFEGMDKIYTYSNLEISTAPIGDEDIISLIVLLDDTVTTKEGLYIGADKDEVINAYGDDYQEQGDAIIYTRNDTQLMFIFDDQTVVSIEYIAVFDT